MRTIALTLWLAGGMWACGDGDVKLTREDREHIDTTSARAIREMEATVDKWCRDSAQAIRQKYVDSLLIVRQQEIQQKTLAAPQY